MANWSIRNAKRISRWFYTQLPDNEAKWHYKELFFGKTFFCNCDDLFESNFFKYFAMNFNFLGLKNWLQRAKLTPLLRGTASLFDVVNLGEKGAVKHPHKIEITRSWRKLRWCDWHTAVEYLLKNRKNTLPFRGWRYFRSAECIELLNEL